MSIFSVLLWMTTTIPVLTVSLPLLQHPSAPTTSQFAEICGVVGNGGNVRRRGGRIIGGREASHGEVPWIVSIQSGTSHFCGGSIISDRHVLSAAHCFSHLESDAPLTAVLGAHRIINTHGESSSVLLYERVGIKTITLHPEFDGGVQFLNDIAILELDQRIVWNAFKRPVCLPASGESSYGRTAASDKNVSAIASGWGKTWGVKEEVKERSDADEELDFEAKYRAHSDVLKTLNLTILPNSECDEYYQKTWNPMTLASSQLCAGVPQTGWDEDTASGDSGGPLAIKSPGGRWTIAGVTSFGTPYKAPGVYCRVSSYLHWIQEVTSLKTKRV